jgi:RimJ/RimL family protein N-acetyltransferase
MSLPPPRAFRLKSGESGEVRAGSSDDAPAVCDLYRDVDTTTDFLVTQPDERNLDPAKRSAWLRRHAEAPDAVVWLAWVEGLLVGILDCVAHSRRRMAHVADLGMAVRSGWRGRGVGTALLAATIEWARGHPTIEKVALGVMAPNARAIALYRRFGFVEEGRRVREYRLGPGRYVDDVTMAVFVKPT